MIKRMKNFKQFLGESKFIEVEEVHGHKDRIKGRTVGGHQEVTIKELPARTLKGHGYSNPQVYYRKTKTGRTVGIVPKAKKEADVHIPTSYSVHHDKGVSWAKNYDHAVKLAVHHARRKPKK